MLLTSPDSFFQSAMGRNITNLRAALDRSSLEMVTGRTQNILKASRGNSEPLLRAQSALDTAEQAQARLTVYEGRYRVASSALRTISTLTESAALAAQTAGDVTAGISADRLAAAEARSALGTAFSTLEARFGGRALFGGELGTGRVLADLPDLFTDLDAAIGSASTAADVEAAIDTYFSGGPFEANIYQGEARLQNPQLADGATVEALFTAASPELRELYKGLAMASLNEKVDAAERPKFLRRSSEVMQTARERLIAEEARMGLSLNAIEREQGRQRDIASNAELTLEAALGRDPFEAASETQALEARLQAAYTVAGRLGSLRLTNYLR